MTGLVAAVIVPVAVDTAYSYRVPEGLALQPGDIVTVPLGTRETTGVVFDLRESASGSNLKPVAARRNLATLQPGLRAFVEWVARWTLAPRGMVLRMAIRAPEGAGVDAPRMAYRLAATRPDMPRLSPARARVLAALADGLARPKSALAEAAQCSPGVVDALAARGAIPPGARPPDPVAAPPDPDFAPATLSAEQAAAASSLRAAVAAHGFSVSLLDGVTGSGKTEVYFEAVAQALRDGGQALVMVPEIALTAQFLDRFAQRFGVRPAEWHSAVQPRRRARLWSGVAEGEVRVVAGARSALFLPFKNLRLIVVDEEHEGAYKQDDGVSYHARDMAVVRGRIEQAAVVLASATPSVESRVNAEQGRYQSLVLPARFGARELPSLEAIDLRRDGPPSGRWLSEPLREAVEQTVAAGDQALLFLNRRGYAPLTLCRACGHRFRCPHCTAWLVEHRFRRALVCHHCGHTERRGITCPECQTEDALAACGPGVERVAEEVAALFPDARVLTLSSDHPGGIERLRQEFDEVARGEYDILIGTQLVAKGHNFPHLTRVGVVDADVGLSGADPLASELTFQLLQQVTGRAGRGDRPGRGLIQTWQPDPPVIRAILAGDREAFYREEVQVRLEAGLPPFGRLAALIVSGTDRHAAEAHARALVRAGFDLPPEVGFALAAIGGAPSPDEIDLLGPAEAPIFMVRGRYRFRILVKTSRRVDVQAFLRAMLDGAPKPKGNLRVYVDIDPQSFL